MRPESSLPPLPGQFKRCDPAKIEIEREDGTRVAPEKCETSDLANLPDAERSGAFCFKPMVWKTNLLFTAQFGTDCRNPDDSRSGELFFPDDSDRPVQWTVKD